MDVSRIFRCHTSQPEGLSRNHVHQEFRTRDAKDSFYFDAFPAAIDQARFRFGVIRLESQQPVYHALLETAGVLHLDGAECIAAIELAFIIPFLPKPAGISKNF